MGYPFCMDRNLFFGAGRMQQSLSELLSSRCLPSRARTSQRGREELREGSAGKHEREGWGGDPVPAVPVLLPEGARAVHSFPPGHPRSCILPRPRTQPSVQGTIARDNINGPAKIFWAATIF